MHLGCQALGKEFAGSNHLYSVCSLFRNEYRDKVYAGPLSKLNALFSYFGGNWKFILKARVAVGNTFRKIPLVWWLITKKWY